MLKHRLIFGTLMTAFFLGLVIVDAYLDGSLTASVEDNKPMQATLLCGLIALLAIPAQNEFSKLAANKNLKLFVPLTIIASILIATSWYWPQMCAYNATKFHLQYILFTTAFSLLAIFIYQARALGNSGVIGNCAANFFSIFYLGFLSSFVLAIRIEFGVWVLLMFVFTVKFSDIGAYTFGKLFGKHKFAPIISPGKTWEGMIGAAITAAIVAMLFARGFGIMAPVTAAAFGICFAFIGQLGDLAESMLKRDAEQKDSADNVPGFGGILDIIDSPLIAAPLAYLFFICVIK